MGNTCASVHIASRGNLDRVTQAILRAYGKIGYERVKKAPPEGSKHVILRAGAGQSYVSVYDSDNAKLDNGELKDLALAATKALKTVAVFTSLYDSDTYEFFVFASGRQIDLLMTDAESYAGPFQRLSDKSRAAKWSTLFGRTITADQIARASAGQTVFADHVVAGLSDLIGLTDGQSQINYEDFADGGEEITAQFYFHKKPTAGSDIPAGEIRLADAFDPDDTRMLSVYPASWPIPVGKTENVRWLILSQGAGFNGGTATIRLSGPDGPVFSKGAMRGFKFHNGQIVGDLETRPTDKDHVKDYYAFPLAPMASDDAGSRLYKAEYPNLSIPPMTPGRTTQILIILALYEFQCQTPGEWEISVSLQPGAQSEYRHDLPPLRIAAVEPGWLPVISGLNPKAMYAESNFGADPRTEQNYRSELKDKQSRIASDRQLIHPAITSSVAILEDDGQATLDACKTWLEAWLAPLAEQSNGEVQVYAEKKLPKLVFKPSKTKKNLPVKAFLQDQAWGRLFDYANNYQSVLVAYFPKDSERAAAGIGLQYSHESHYFLDQLMPGQEYAKQMAKTLTVMRGRPFAEEAYRSTLHAFQWITNHPDCYEYLKTSASDMGQQMDRFAARNAPLQAWHGQSTWVPLFDQAARGQFTPYENVSALNWFRGVVGGGLHRKLMCAQWCSNVLRMLTPLMWLCRNLMDQVNRTALDEVAQVTETNGTFGIALRSGRGLDELELALLPILPTESARISVR
ncbi:hypothetical protein SBA2_50010 [Acidobacteriia bacterium SbA2]|nr:hypothetical protein SBA2_50010 [Acidobacteriia bacterium SbA2]